MTESTFWKDNLDNDISVGDTVLCLTVIDKFRIKEVKSLSTKQDVLCVIPTVIFVDGGRLDSHNVLDLTALGVSESQVKSENIGKPYFDAIGNEIHEGDSVFYFPRLAYNGDRGKIDKLSQKLCIIDSSRKPHGEVVSMTAIEKIKQCQHPDYHAIHKYCTNNHEALLRAKKCGCFYCCTIFNPAEITEWVEQDDSAVCPHCGIDSVIPESETGEYELTEELLKEMYKVWFE